MTIIITRPADLVVDPAQRAPRSQLRKAPPLSPGPWRCFSCVGRPWRG